MSRPRKTKPDYTRFAVLYVNGPAEVRGNWEAAERLSGVKADPQDADVRNAITKEGGSVPVNLSAPLNAPMPTTVLGDVLGNLSSLAATAKSEDDWKQLADQLQPTIVEIAKGTIKASASQTAIIKHILDRAYGRVVAAQSEKQMPIGVVILPTLGDRANMQLCPRCGFHLGIDQGGKKNE